MVKVLILSIWGVICFATKKKLNASAEKKYVNLYLLNISVWLILVLLSLTHYVNLPSLRTDTLFWLMIGSLFFSLGYLCANKKSGLSEKKDNRKEPKKVDNEKLFIVIQIMLCFVLLYYFIKYQRLLSIHGIGMARMIKFQLGLLFSNKLSSYFFQYIVTAILKILIFYQLYVVIVEEKVKKQMLITVINILLYSLIGQGRFIFLEIGIIIVVLGIYKISKDPTYLARYWKRLVVSLSILIICMFLMTFLRMGGSILSINRFPMYWGRIIQQVYTYFCGPFKSLDYYMHRPVEQTFFMGEFTFYTVLHPLASLISKLTGTVFDNPMVFLQQEISLSEYTTFNALYTYYANFYFDFSYIGFIVMPFFVGCFTYKSISMMDGDLFSRLLGYSIYTYTLMGIFRWEFQNYEVIFMLVILFGIRVLDKEMANGKIIGRVSKKD